MASSSAIGQPKNFSEMTLWDFSNFDWFSVEFFQGQSQFPKEIKETLLYNFLFSLWKSFLKAKF